MKVGIIAAGLGERLRQGGFVQPKPLVPVAGKPLIDYVLGAVADAGLREIACIVNEESRGIEAHCRRQWPELQFEFVRRTTPSSMESLFTLSPWLQAERFLLLTVDAIFAPGTLRTFLAATNCRRSADGVLAVSGFVHDEKPLWVQLAPGGRITALGPSAQPVGRERGLVTAGFYVFNPTIFDEIAAARQARFTALREFLGHLLARGYRLYGKRVSKTVDVDRPEDIGVAEAFVRGGLEG
jgi:NDP-sugar pyrophosphorylase family protein